MMKLNISYALLLVATLLSTVTGRIQFHNTPYNFEISESQPIGSDVEGHVRYLSMSFQTPTFLFTTF